MEELAQRQAVVAGRRVRVRVRRTSKDAADRLEKPWGPSGEQVRRTMSSSGSRWRQLVKQTERRQNFEQPPLPPASRHQPHIQMTSMPC